VDQGESALAPNVKEIYGNVQNIIMIYSSQSTVRSTHGGMRHPALRLQYESN
jgi:hypothetical protein